MSQENAIEDAEERFKIVRTQADGAYKKIEKTFLKVGSKV